MRSLLFVPGDSAHKMQKALTSTADALILDLEDSVTEASKASARLEVQKILQCPDRKQALFVRVNAFDTVHTAVDLAAIMGAAPDGIVLPKCASPDDVLRLGYMLDALEAAHGITPQKIQILAIVTETAASLFSLKGYDVCRPRLWGMMWGAEDLSAALGAVTNTENGVLLEPYRLARNLCLLAAAAAGVVAVDAVSTVINDLPGLQEEARCARRDGFGAKAIIHPKHIDSIHAGFQPTAAEIAKAKRIIEAFDNHSGTGVLTMDGKMIDKPHLQGAVNILASIR